VELPAVIVKLLAVVPPVVLNAFAAPVLDEDEEGVTATAPDRVAAFPNGSCIVTVMMLEFAPAVLELAPENASLLAVAALTVKPSALGLANAGELASLLVVMLKVPANSS
jgi:hypothetical protein